MWFKWKKKSILFLIFTTQEFVSNRRLKWRCRSGDCGATNLEWHFTAFFFGSRLSWRHIKRKDMQMKLCALSLSQLKGRRDWRRRDRTHSDLETERNQFLEWKQFWGQRQSCSLAEVLKVFQLSWSVNVIQLIRFSGVDKWAFGRMLHLFRAILSKRLSSSYHSWRLVQSHTHSFFIGPHCVDKFTSCLVIYFLPELG